jgi:uncharacterized protein YgiM (DUF1202 family)
MRSGPGAGFSVVRVLGAGFQLTLLSRNADGSWIEVQIPGGTTGWVKSDFIAPSVDIGSLGVSAQTSRYNAVTTASFLNIRSGPGANFDVIGRMSYGNTFDLLGRNADNSWVQIGIPGGVVGWVSSRYISASARIGTLPLVSNTGVFPTFPQAAAVDSAISGGQTGIVTAPSLAVRYGPATYFGSFKILHSGEGVSLVGRSGNGVWLLVQLANGSTGWVATGYIYTAFPIELLPARA